MENTELRAILKAHDWQQATAARLLGLTPRHFDRLYHGHAPIRPTTAKLARLLNELAQYDELDPTLKEITGL